MTIDDWIASGLGALTGPADRAPDFSRAPVLAEARATLARFVAAVDSVVGPADWADDLSTIDAAQLLSGRAALNGYQRRGRISAGGSTRLLAAQDQWVALTLSRDSDIELLPALFSLDSSPDDSWATAESVVAALEAREFVERARLLGLPASVLGEAAPQAPRVRDRGVPGALRRGNRLLVADLSSLWAGPLCGQLLARAGAQAVKVESPVRPDGARRGNPIFFDWINGGKLSYAGDFHQHRDQIAKLLSRADVVIEASRPRTLRAHGLSADQLDPRPGQVWLRITAHGADEPGADWVGFGDDTAVAGGLVAHTAHGPVFCGDAIADPLTGIEAARLVGEALAVGGGHIIDVSLAHTAARYAALGTAKRSREPVAAPPLFRSTVVSPGPELGANNDEVERLFAT